MRQRKWIAAIAGLLLVTAAATAQELPIRRFGLFVGANDGGTERITLRWAVSDAERMATVMQQIGGIDPRDAYILENPTEESLALEFRHLGDRIELASEGTKRTEVVVYYSGHSDESGMMLGDDHYSYVDFRRAIDELEADVAIAILDSCASGAFTRLKGGSFIQPFLLDDGSQMTGHAFLTSSSEDEASQESDALGSSFFTHYLVSGLLGAADSSKDGKVTLDEVYLYAREETLARTINTFAGPQNPSFDFQLSGTGSLILTNLNVLDSALLFDESVDGRLFISRDSGGLVAEVDKREGEELRLALPADDYVITLQGDSRNYTHDVTLTSGDQTSIAGRDFRVTFLDRNRVRGDNQQPTPFSLTVLPGLDPGVTPYQTTFALGLVVGEAYRVEGGMLSSVLSIAREDLYGVQMSGVGNIIGGNHAGVQTSGVFNTVNGSLFGWQNAGVFNVSEGEAGIMQTAGVFNLAKAGFDGVQIAGVFNAAEGPLNGAQVSGVYNRAGNTRGAQISLINVAGDVSGAQIGLVNIGKRVSGTQIGLVNISEEMYGIPIGLATIVEKGIHNVSVWWEGEEKTWLGAQNGSNMFYTLAYAGIDKDGKWTQLDGFGVGAGFGIRLESRPFYADFDLGWKRMTEGSNPEERFNSLWDPSLGAAFPSARISAGVALGGGLGWFFGGTFDIQDSSGWDNMGYFSDSDSALDLGTADLPIRIHTRFFTGFKL